VVTVAGTNGKGSTVAWLAAALRGAGRSVACYTSPHIRRFNERLLLPEGEVSDEALVEAFERVEAARGTESLTYFEFTTLACLWIMARRAPDVAVLEVGLGGRLDTVNLVDADVAVITVVGLDHQEFLGDDRESIGREKAGVLRHGRPLVCAEADPPASVLAAAKVLDCPVLLPGRDWRLEAHAGGGRFQGGGVDLALPPLPMAGAHQRQNLGAALAACSLLAPDLSQHADGVHAALETVSVPGRLQRVAAEPRLLLDVGHNPLAAGVVARTLKAGGGRWACVLAMLRDKDASGVSAALGEAVHRWYCAGLDGPRGQSGPELALRLAGRVGSGRVREFEGVPDALEAALREEGEGTGILVFGSFHTVDEAMEWLSRRRKKN